MGGAPDPPLIAGKIHGLRSWGLAIRAGEICLASPFQDMAWSARGEATEAGCTEGHGGDGTSPVAECGCGLYALHPRCAEVGQLLAIAHPDESEPRCSGLVEAWGRIEVHRTGFRAQYARPMVLFLPATAQGGDYEATVRRVAEHHDAEVVVVDGTEDVVDYCQRRGLGLSPGAVQRLLGSPDDEIPPEPPSPPPAGAGSRALDFLGAVGSAAVSALVGLIVLIWSGAMAAGAVLVALGFLGVEFGGHQRAGEDAARSRAAASRLETPDTRIGSIGGGVVYVTRVRNPSDTTAAVNVRLVGRLVDPTGQVVAPIRGPRTDQLRPTIPPGATGVVAGWVERTPSREARIGAGVSALSLRGEVAQAKSTKDAREVPTLSFSSPAVDRESCVIDAEVRSARPFAAARVMVLAFRGGRPTAVLDGQAGPLGPDPVRQALLRLDPSSCAAGGGRTRFEVYPDLRRGELRGTRR